MLGPGARAEDHAGDFEADDRRPERPDGIKVVAREPID
jgi:hypothetical protein